MLKRINQIIITLRLYFTTYHEPYTPSMGGGYKVSRNYSIVLKDRFIPTKRHCNVELKVDQKSLCVIQVGMVNPRLLWLTLLATGSEFRFYQIPDSLKGIIWVLGNRIPDSFKGIIRFPGSLKIGSSRKYIFYYQTWTKYSCQVSFLMTYNPYRFIFLL